MDSIVDIANTGVVIPIWYVLTGAGSLIYVGWLASRHAAKMVEAVKSNIEQNNINIATQNAILRQIVCLTTMHLRSLKDPNLQYNGECEKILIEELSRIGRK